MVVRQISSQEEFKGLLVGSSEKLVVIDFYAVWCGPCKLISPEIDKLSESHSSVIFGKVDVDQLDSIAAEAGVNAMPTFHFYKGGKKVDEVIGANLNAIKEKIQKHAISVSSGNRVGGEATSSSNSNISGDKKLLIEMGFPEWKVTKALKATKNAGLQPALDWLDQHANDVEQEEDVDNNGGAGGGNRVGSEPASEVPEANSLVCDDCGKLFRSSDLAQFHATKTGHSNFSQSVEEVKPLTEEEKAAQLEKARILLREKQEQQRLKDIEQAKENERIRRKAGKDAQEFRDRKAQEDMRIAAEQRRKEKIEDLQQRARIKAQIEQDRLDKARRLQGGIFLDSTSKNTEPTSSSSTAPKSTSDSCRIQVRFSDGLPPFTGTFKAEDTLKTVYEKVAEYRSSKGKSNSSVAGKLSTNVPPRRVLDCAGSEGDKSLSELGLLPSSLLIYQ